LDISFYLLHMAAGSFTIGLEDPGRAIAGKIAELIPLDFVEFARI